VALVNEVFTPSPEQLARAQEIVRTYAQAALTGTGAVAMSDREFVDAAAVRRAEALLQLAGSLGAPAKVVER
jgi:citrate lyase beta subunit